jgi:uncharacterized protein
MSSSTATLHSARHSKKIAEELKLAVWQVEATVALMDDGATLPFVARYRKEATGSLDEVQIGSVRDRTAQLRELDKRRDAILKSLQEREILTDDLRQDVLAAVTLTALEDIYLPYRPKRRTRATIAKERGLGPLAESIFAQGGGDPAAQAAAFVDPEQGVASAEEALAGARDIIAEQVSEDPEVRAGARRVFIAYGAFNSSATPGREAEGAKYRDYFDWEEPVGMAPSHRVLAMFRGEKEGFLKLRLGPPENRALVPLEALVVKGDGAAALQVRAAVHDGYRRLLAPSMEIELRQALKKRADEDAIAVFALNLRQLLLAPPLGQKNVLAIDPGFRTGCKVVCLDRQGKLTHTDTLYLNQSKKLAAEAGERLNKLVRRHKIEAIAIGNGTGGRETEEFVRGLGLGGYADIVMVSENGASVYSASDIAREEFPDQDVTLRGAISIGRRLMDPLAELVKIDPKSIGVGQYQHDVDDSALRNSLSEVVVSCVNGVGVEVNTASKQLLAHVSGLGPQLAQNIVDHGAENGPFRSRNELKKVARLGAKAYEQAAGFLRITGGDNPLDRSAVHPESYGVVESMARDLGCSVDELMSDADLRRRLDPKRYVTKDAGEPTIRHIMEELARPGRDPREHFEAFQFAEGVSKIEDLKAGMTLPGIVTNITSFGAFVDVGVHQDGLVHVSQLADRFVNSPGDVVKVQQNVSVTVLEVDLDRGRISLSMRKDATQG